MKEVDEWKRRRSQLIKNAPLTTEIEIVISKPPDNRNHIGQPAEALKWRKSWPKTIFTFFNLFNLKPWVEKGSGGLSLSWSSISDQKNVRKIRKMSKYRFKPLYRQKRQSFHTSRLPHSLRKENTPLAKMEKNDHFPDKWTYKLLEKIFFETDQVNAQVNDLIYILQTDLYIRTRRMA